MPDNTMVRVKSHIKENPKSSIALAVTTLLGATGAAIGGMTSLQSRDVAIHADPSSAEVRAIVEEAARPIEHRLTSVEGKVDKLTVAMIGDPLTGQKGMVQKITEMEWALARASQGK